MVETLPQNILAVGKSHFLAGPTLGNKMTNLIRLALGLGIDEIAWESDHRE
ncbi:MAG: hypothetical protein AAF773_05955 [Cyanobacteria bacterium P01_D01_bin.115]